MTEMITISIVVVAVLLTAVVAYLSVKRQKKAVMDEVERLSLRLTEMETRLASSPTPSQVGEEVASIHSSQSSVPRQRGEREAVGGKESGNDLGDKTPDLSAMTDEKLFGYLSKTIKDEEMFRRPDLNRSAVKEHFSLSKVRIGNAFVRGGGMGLPEFVRNCRLDYACRLMVEQPKMSFTEVGYQSGYQRTTTFYHDFKARFGMPPAEYREQALRKQSEF